MTGGSRIKPQKRFTSCWKAKSNSSRAKAAEKASHKAKTAARTCSGGERRKLEIARSLITKPRLILLDEPFSGVDPIAVEELQDEIRRLAGAGIAICRLAASGPGMGQEPLPPTTRMRPTMP